MTTFEWGLEVIRGQYKDMGSCPALIVSTHLSGDGEALLFGHRLRTPFVISVHISRPCATREVRCPAVHVASRDSKRGLRGTGTRFTRPQLLGAVVPPDSPFSFRVLASSSLEKQKCYACRIVYPCAHIRENKKKSTKM